MRWLVVIGLVAACYQPAAEVPCAVSCVPGGTCPDGTSCGASLRCEPIGGPACSSGSGGSDSGVGDGTRTIDSPPPLCQFSAFSVQDTLTDGNWYTPDRPDSLAIYSDPSTTAVYLAHVLDSMSFADYGMIIPANAAGATSLGGARLAPGGNQIFVLVNKSSTSGLYFAGSADNWSALTQITLLDENNGIVTLSSASAPGAPSGTTPRRMPIASGANAFDEYEEITLTTWKRIQHYTAADLQVPALADASFTSDGRRVAFMASNGGPVSVWYAERSDLSSQFMAATALVTPTGGGQMPYISADCLHVYCTTGGVVQHFH